MTGTALAHWPHDDEATTTTGAETCGTVVQALLVWLDVGTVGATTGAETADAETAGVVAGTLLVWPHVRLYDGTVVVGTDDQVVQRLLVFPDAGEDDTTVGAGAGDGVAATLLGVGTDATTVGCETTAEVAEIPLAWPQVKLVEATVVVGTDDQVVHRLLVFPDAGTDDVATDGVAADEVATTPLVKLRPKIWPLIKAMMPTVSFGMRRCCTTDA